jgi:hypothetical protein
MAMGIFHVNVVVITTMHNQKTEVIVLIATYVRQQVSHLEIILETHSHQTMQHITSHKTRLVGGATVVQNI